MKKTDTCHPLPLLLFFLAAVLYSVLYTHPVPAALSLIGGACFLGLYHPIPMGEIPFYLLLFLTVCLGNPIFVPRGRTVLFFLFKIPITIESLVAGVVNGTVKTCAVPSDSSTVTCRSLPDPVTGRSVRANAPGATV